MDQHIATFQAVVQQATVAVQQATVVANTIGANVCEAVTALNLPQYYGPVLANVRATVGPQLAQASEAILPIVAPYLEIVEPYIGGARPHLDAISQEETLLIVGGIFGGVVVIQLLLALTATCRKGASALKAFTPTVFWLLMSFIIHSWIEYNFVFNRRNGVSGFENGMNLYGAADFRYGFGEQIELEPGTAAMEAITAFVSGPLCLILAWGIVGNKAWRWTLQIIVCTCQIYGLTWFAAHPFWSSEKVTSDDPFLYWVLFVGFNAPWGIVPPILLLSAMCKINRTMNKAQVEAKHQAQIKKATTAIKKTQ